MEKLESIINDMLKENTGKHFLDSGGAYGRHWERNQGRDFEKEEACLTEIRADEEGTITELMVTFNLYHFLKAHLDIDEVTEELQKKFDEFSQEDSQIKETWEDVQKDFCKRYNINAKNSYYTYNFGTILSQDIVVAECETEDGEDFIFLRVHNGCDARGGFTAPKIFRKCEYFEIAMSACSAYCYGKSEGMKEGETGLFDLPNQYCRNNWISDDGGYDWYFDGCTLNEKDLFATVRYDEETKKCYCRECGGEIIFSVTESW
ncbi:hypothetical protein AUJ64_02490 [Candidatus Pacearchaeota archaeon CG1_02_39_14]|nr:MAG: hypothetical protein AUJ64_02490 [Candidatus Pacearchaeota archaeon CG1_02_39_14]